MAVATIDAMSETCWVGTIIVFVLANSPELHDVVPGHAKPQGFHAARLADRLGYLADASPVASRPCEGIATPGLRLLVDLAPLAPRL
jgi:hypothetical protein